MKGGKKICCLCSLVARIREGEKDERERKK